MLATIEWFYGSLHSSKWNCIGVGLAYSIMLARSICIVLYSNLSMICISSYCTCKLYIGKISTYSNVIEHLYHCKLLAIINLLWTFFTCFMEYMYIHYHWVLRELLGSLWGWMFSSSEDITNRFLKLFNNFCLAAVYKSDNLTAKYFYYL